MTGNANSAKYPNNPTNVSCVNNIKREVNDFMDNYGFRFTGYFYPSYDSAYVFQAKVDHHMVLYLKDNGTEIELGSATVNGQVITNL